MALRLVDLPNGEQYVCFRGRDAEDKMIDNYVCGTMRQDAVKLAFIDITKGKPAITHVTVVKYGRDGRMRELANASIIGKERFREFPEYEQAENEMLEKALAKYQKAHEVEK